MRRSAIEPRGSMIDVRSPAIEPRGSAIEIRGSAIESHGPAIEIRRSAIETRSYAIEGRSFAIETRSSVLDESGRDRARPGLVVTISGSIRSIARSKRFAVRLADTMIGLAIECATLRTSIDRSRIEARGSRSSIAKLRVSIAKPMISIAERRTSFLRAIVSLARPDRPLRGSRTRSVRSSRYRSRAIESIGRRDRSISRVGESCERLLHQVPRLRTSRGRSKASIARSITSSVDARYWAARSVGASMSSGRPRSACPCARASWPCPCEGRRRAMPADLTARCSPRQGNVQGAQQGREDVLAELALGHVGQRGLHVRVVWLCVDHEPAHGRLSS